MPKRFHGKPWAITADAHEAMVAMLEKENIGLNYRDEETDIAVEIIDSVALIRVSGALQKEPTRHYFWMESESTYTQIREDVQAALDNSSVQAVCLKIGSPGGDVDGIKELSDFLYRANKIKPIYAYVDGEMCSAAYWIGSISKEIAAPATAQVGSIGVRTMHVDRSKAQEKYGYKITYITAGKYKAMGNSAEPLNSEAHAYIQDHIDRLYSIFIDDVARNRGVDTNKALSMADGKIFLAKDAKDVGLIDRIEESLETFLARIKENEEAIEMEYEDLKAKHPDLYNKVLNKGRDAAQADAEEHIKKETDRIIGIASAVFGKEQGEKLGAMAATGATIEQINAFSQAFGGTEANEQEESLNNRASRDKILEGLQSAHSPGVNPEKGVENTDDLDKKATALAELIK